LEQQGGPDEVNGGKDRQQAGGDLQGEGGKGQQQEGNSANAPDSDKTGSGKAEVQQSDEAKQQQGRGGLLQPPPQQQLEKPAAAAAAAHEELVEEDYSNYEDESDDDSRGLKVGKGRVDDYESADEGSNHAGSYDWGGGYEDIPPGYIDPRIRLVEPSDRQQAHEEDHGDQGKRFMDYPESGLRVPVDTEGLQDDGGWHDHMGHGGFGDPSVHDQYFGSHEAYDHGQPFDWAMQDDSGHWGDTGGFWADDGY
jgi:hypothetical protein